MHENVKRVRGGENVNVPRREDALDARPGVRVFGDTGSSLRGETGTGEVDLLLREHPVRLDDVGKVRKHAERSDGDRETDDGVDDEDPPPAGAAELAVQRGVDTTLKNQRKQRAESTGSLEQGGTLAELLLGVPRSDEVVETGVVGRLEQSDEKADGIELLIVRDPGRAKGHEGPSELERENDIVRRKTRQHDVARNLADNVADDPAGGGVVELKAVHVQVLLHSTDEGGIEIGLVKIPTNETKNGEHQKRRVELPDELAF